MKECKDCGQLKPLTEFSLKPSCKDGYSVRCKRCHTIKYKFSTKENLVKKIYFSQKEKSVKRNHPLPSYSYDELLHWLVGQSNSEKLFDDWVMSGYQRKLTPSVDRIDYKKPYTLSNIQLVTAHQNILLASRDRKTGYDNRHMKAVACYDKQGNLIKEYHSINEALRDLGVTSHHGITSVANGKPIKDGKGNYYMPKTYKGFIWKWA